jgi:hypothetical protein
MFFGVCAASPHKHQKNKLYIHGERISKWDGVIFLHPDRLQSVYPWQRLFFKEHRMPSEPIPTGIEKTKTKVIHQHSTYEAVYGLGFIGAIVYYIGHATTFWLGVLGFCKAIVWPAMLVYEALKHVS